MPDDAGHKARREAAAARTEELRARRASKAEQAEDGPLTQRVDALEDALSAAYEAVAADQPPPRRNFKLIQGGAA